MTVMFIVFTTQISFKLKSGISRYDRYGLRYRGSGVSSFRLNAAQECIIEENDRFLKQRKAFISVSGNA